MELMTELRNWALASASERNSETRLGIFVTHTHICEEIDSLSLLSLATRGGARSHSFLVLGSRLWYSEFERYNKEKTKKESRAKGQWEIYSADETGVGNE